jgi:hypothetical protein
MYDLELPDFADKVAQRREAARKTLRPASNEELQALGRELFPDGTHPWATTFSQFVEDHKAESALRGETFEMIGLFTTRVQIAASGTKESAKPMPLVYWIKPRSRSFPKSCPKLGISDGDTKAHAFRELSRIPFHRSPLQPK